MLLFFGLESLAGEMSMLARPVQLQNKRKQGAKNQAKHESATTALSFRYWRCIRLLFKSVAQCDL